MDENPNERFCAGYGYNLHGISSTRCPECGLPIEADGGTLVAWEARRMIGRITALRTTFVQGTFQVGRLARAAGRPVDRCSSELFRAIVAVLASAPLIASFLVAVHMNGGAGFLSLWQPNTGRFNTFAPGSPWGWEFALMWSAGATIICVLPIGILMTVYLGTGVLRFFVWTRQMSPERRRRASSQG